MSSISQRLNKNFRYTYDIVRSYPLVILSSIIATFCLCYIINLDQSLSQNQDNRSAQDVALNIMMVCILGISFLFGINIFSKSRNISHYWNYYGVAILVLLYFYMPFNIYQSTSLLHYTVLFTASHLTVAFLIFLNRDLEQQFWEFNKNLFINIVITVIFCGILTLGVLIALLGFDKLFGTNIDSDLYLTVSTLLTITGSVAIFLHLLGTDLDVLLQRQKYPVILKFFTIYILIPLMLIYGSILYVYLLKILIEWNLPRGWVTYLVVAYSVFGILSLLLIYPLKDIENHRWIRLFYNLFYYSLIPLVALMGVGIYIRIMQYGLTESRYYVVLLSLWLLCISIYFILIRNPKIKVIPVTLFLLAILSIFTPYINVVDLSIHSQVNRFVKILNSTEILSKDGKIDFDRPITYDSVDELQSIQKYLLRYRSIDKVKHFYDDEVYNKNVKGHNNTFRSLFKNIDKSNREKSLESYYSINLNSMDDNYRPRAIKIKERTYLIQDFEFSAMDIPIHENLHLVCTGNNNITQKQNKLMLSMYNAEHMLDSLDLLPWLNSILESYEPSTVFYKNIDLIHNVKLDDKDITIALRSLNKNKYTHDESKTSYYLKGSILIELPEN